MLLQSLPVFHVILPLCAAALCAIVNRGRIAWWIATLAVWGSLLSILLLTFAVSDAQVMHYALGGHPAPIGIEYRFDALNLLVLLVVAFMGAVMMPYAYHSVARDIPPAKQGLFYSIYLLCLAGLYGILSTNDIFNIYVFLEISSLATYALIAMGRDKRALVASYQYLIVGTIGATFILISIGLLYVMTGTLNISDMANRIGSVADERPVEAAFAFLTIGIAMKVALFPLHMWLTNAYAFSPGFVTAFLASTATKVSLYIFIRLLYSLFGYEYAFALMPLGIILASFAAANILIGSLNAVFQHNVKRLLAFSSIAQIGYIVLALALATQPGLIAALTHIANHALAKGLLFLCVCAVALQAGDIKLQHFYGAARQMPWTMAMFLVGAASLIGVPGTAGFISKWLLLEALIEKGWWWMVILVVVSSLLAVIYLWRIVDVSYFRSRPDTLKPLKEAPYPLLVSMAALSLANIYFGLDTTMTYRYAGAAARNLMEASPALSAATSPTPAEAVE